MFPWEPGTHQTNGATANYRVGGYASTATPVPVATVCKCFGCPFSGLIHYFIHQAHPAGASGGFASASQFSATPMVSAHDMLGTIFSSNAISCFPGERFAPSANGFSAAESCSCFSHCSTRLFFFGGRAASSGTTTWGCLRPSTLPVSSGFVPDGHAT